MDDYYKIVPPAFAYLWVSINFTKPIPSVEVVAPVVETPAVETPAVEPAAEPNEAPVEVVPEPVPTETMLDKYNALREQVEAERAKPREQQNYTNMKEALIKIAENKTDDKVARYAAFVLKQVEGFELALAVTKQVQLQNDQLQKIKERINKARAARLAKFQDLGRFAAVGQLRTFTTYGPGHYRIINEAGKTVCYALPSDQVSKVKLSRLIDQKVGLVGTIEPHPQSAGALVRFTEIAELD